ncbi:hypothetical protein TYRP_013208 [Tyrophagus putrescentiae]|nr:hypothetical protein TYRP_013208 [Tyrophagus putrescentiae]
MRRFIRSEDNARVSDPGERAMKLWPEALKHAAWTDAVPTDWLKGREYADSRCQEWGDYSEGEADMNLPIKNLIGSLQFMPAGLDPTLPPA